MAFRIGARASFKKPFDTRQVTEAIERLLHARKSAQERRETVLLRTGDHSPEVIPSYAHVGFLRALNYLEESFWVEIP